MINCEHIFPTPIWSFQFPVDKDELITKAYNFKNSCEGREVSNQGGWQSLDLDLKSLPKSLDKFKTFVEKNIYMFEREYGPLHNELVFDNCWFNINPTGSINKSHIHGGSFLSGVLYIQTPEDCGNIVFHRSSLEEYALASNVPFPSTRCGHTAWQYTAMENLCVVFPSWLSHRVEINKSETDRISLAFNLSWKK